MHLFQRMGGVGIILAINNQKRYISLIVGVNRLVAGDRLTPKLSVSIF